MSNTTKSSSIDTGEFIDFLFLHRDERESNWREGYYHVDVVADAYSKGAEDTESRMVDARVKQLFEGFIRRAQQAYSSTKLVIKNLKEEGFVVKGFFINVDKKTPNVIIVVDNDLMLNDDFVKSAYDKMAHEIEYYFKSFNEVFDMGLMGHSGLDMELLKSDGYSYQEKTT